MAVHAPERADPRHLMLNAATLRRAAILTALVAALGVISCSSAMQEVLLDALTQTDEVIDSHPIAGAVVFIALAAISAMVAFVSIALVVPAAVFSWGMPMSVVLLWLGWIIGGVATYGIGRFLGRPVVRWLASEEALQRVEAHLPADAPLALIVLLQLALPSEIPGYVLGLLRYPFGRYAAALAMAELPYVLATVYLGESFVEGRSGLIVLVGILMIFGSLAMLIALRRASRDTDSTAPVHPGPAQRR